MESKALLHLLAKIDSIYYLTNASLKLDALAKGFHKCLNLIRSSIQFLGMFLVL